MTLFDRIGIDYGRKLAAEDAVRHAAAHQVRVVDVQIDIAPNALESFDAGRCAGLRALCDEHGVQFGLHTLSAVNIAELSPFMRDAVDQYLRSYIDIARAVGAGWVVVHAGYHFTTDRDRRVEASLARLRRACAYAEEQGVLLLLENMNREPDHAEVHYLASPLAETRWYFDQIPSPALGWSFTINHATLEPEGIAGFLAGMPAERLREVRLADNNGEYEIHLRPGDGIVDWADTFAQIERTGFIGHYICAFGTLGDMLDGRHTLAAVAKNAGIA